MSTDEQISISEEHAPNDFIAMAGGAWSGIPNKKLAMLFFVIMILLLSDVFLRRILGNISGATTPCNGITTTTYGSFIIAFISALSIIGLSILIKNDYL